ATVLAGDYTEGVRSHLVSPAFLVPPASQNPRLRFWHWFNFNDSDFGQVQIRINDGAWTNLGPAYAGSGGGVWTYESIDLNAYAGQNVQLAFYFQSDVNFFTGGGAVGP